MVRFAQLAALVGLLLLPVPSAEAQDGESAEALTSPTQRVLACVVVDSAGIGIDPIVAPHVTNRIRETVRAMGYHLVGADAMGAGARAVRMAYPPTLADLWRITHVTHAARGVFARVSAQAGQYVVEITVASVDGTGPFVERAVAGADDLLATVDAVLRRLLPPPSRWDPEEAERLADRATGAAPVPQASLAGSVFGPSVFGGGSFQPTLGGASAVSLGLAEPPHPYHRLALALYGEVAFGTGSADFRNGLVGGRFEYRITRDVIVSASLAYANLKGRTQRVSNLLPMAQLEGRIRITSQDGVSIPMRLGLGYLPNNCVVLRLAGGFNVPIGDRFELGFDLLAPTFWFLKDGRVVSFDLTAEVIYRFGPQGR